MSTVQAVVGLALTCCFRFAKRGYTFHGTGL